jgi:hypothetical protein
MNEINFSDTVKKAGAGIPPLEFFPSLSNPVELR